LIINELRGAAGARPKIFFIFSLRFGFSFGVFQATATVPFVFSLFFFVGQIAKIEKSHKFKKRTIAGNRYLLTISGCFSRN
jgi:hypothetical protein